MKKMQHLKSSLLVVLVMTFVTGLLSPIRVAAATNSIASGNGYRISPVRTDLVINRGETKTTTVYLTNISTATVNLQVVINDFQSRDDTGTPALLLNGQSLPQHGLKQYASVATAELTIKPGEQKTINVTLSFPSNATPGGYYGAVRFLPANSNGTRNVNLAASVGTLILVKVPGDVHENLSLTTFGVSRGVKPYSLFFNNHNLNIITKFQNNGDVQEEPFGKVQLKKGNNVLATYEVNNTDPRGNVLPGSIRKFTIPLNNKVGNFGKYTLEGNFGYGSNGQLISAKSTFYIVPLVLVAVIVVITLLIVIAIFAVPRAVRRHDRRILRMTRRR